MKKKIIDIPEVSLSDVKEFWVLGSQYKDGILGEYNLKMDVKKAILGGEGSDSEEDIWYDYSSYSYPQDSGHGVDIPCAEFTAVFPEVGQSVKIKEPDGQIHIYTADYDRMVKRAISSEEATEKGMNGEWLCVNAGSVGDDVSWYPYWEE